MDPLADCVDSPWLFNLVAHGQDVGARCHALVTKASLQSVPSLREQTPVLAETIYPYLYASFFWRHFLSGVYRYSFVDSTNSAAKFGGAEISKASAFQNQSLNIRKYYLSYSLAGFKWFSA